VSSILLSLRVKATPQRAFDVFVKEIAAWWQPNMLFRFTPGAPGKLAFEPCAGGRFTESLADGSVFEIGRIVAWEPPSRLAFTWRQAGFSASEVTEVEVRFEPRGEATQVTVEHRGWDTIAQTHVARHTMPDAMFLQRHGEHWQNVLSAFYRALA
jgi:uncharacterized protein YndB with AHSA1/START domain